MKSKLSVFILSALLFCSVPSYAAVVEGAEAVVDSAGNVLVLIVKGTVDIVKAITITPAKKIVEVVTDTAKDATTTAEVGQ